MFEKYKNDTLNLLNIFRNNGYIYIEIGSLELMLVLE